MPMVPSPISQDTIKLSTYLFHCLLFVTEEMEEVDDDIGDDNNDPILFSKLSIIVLLSKHP